MINLPTLEMNGRWLYDQSEGKVFNAWDKNNLLVYLGTITSDTTFNLEVTAKNLGVVPPNYPGFYISIYAVNGTNLQAQNLGNLTIPASREEYKTATTKIKVKAGNDVKINLVWTNDVYSPARYDSNIMISRVLLYN